MHDPVVLRRLVYSLLLMITVGMTAARIIGVEFVYDPSLYHAYPARVWPKEKPERSPTFSSNDRSRWATVRALVENGTLVIGKRIDDPNTEKGYRDEGVVFQDGYRTVDVMLNPETKEFYSTKPPLFTLMVAGEYWLLNKTLGWTLQENRWEVVCTALITFNLIPIILMLLCLIRLLEDLGTTDWGRIFVFATACLGTFLTTFSITLNNHVPGTTCVLLAVGPLLRTGLPLQTWSLLQAGFWAGMAVTFELPAAALAAALVGYIFLQTRSFRSVLIYSVVALVPMMALVGTNYLATGEIEPGYAKLDTPWYNYAGSHWSKRQQVPPPPGIDFIREDKLTYTFHLTFGHHGLFSLTPVWLLAMLGFVWKQSTGFPSGLFRLICFATFAVVMGYYIYKTNNYGGWTCGPRWLFWLNPLFLLLLIPVADRLSNAPWGRRLALLLLGISIFSVNYPVWNPWRHPWIYQLCQYLGWLNYQ